MKNELTNTVTLFRVDAYTGKFGVGNLIGFYYDLEEAKVESGAGVEIDARDMRDDTPHIQITEFTTSAELTDSTDLSSLWEDGQIIKNYYFEV